MHLDADALLARFTTDHRQLIRCPKSSASATYPKSLRFRFQVISSPAFKLGNHAVDNTHVIPQTAPLARQSTASNRHRTGPPAQDSS